MGHISMEGMTSARVVTTLPPRARIGACTQRGVGLFLSHHGHH